MEREVFREIVEQHLLPLFSGAQVESGYQPSTRRRSAVRWNTICSLELKPSKRDGWCIRITRSQPFTQLQTGLVSEYAIACAFVSGLANMPEGFEHGPYAQDLLAHFTRRVAVTTVCPPGQDPAAMLAAVDRLDTWSTRLYEGQPIAAAVGFVPDDSQSDVTLAEAWAEDFSTVLTNGYDTMLTATYRGNVLGYEALTPPVVMPTFAPHRLALIAEWSSQHPDRVALVLNRMGEILVLRRGQLVFARRGGCWHFLAPETVITQMGGPQDLGLRQAIYASCLDASFARTGACIGVLTAGRERRLAEVAPGIGDHVGRIASPKSRVLYRAVGERMFQDLDRRLRQEILAIDGATILDHRGLLLAAGAILGVSGASTTGGGRRAAAVALASYGVGIKISQDGGIEGFRRPTDGSDEHPTFKLMK